MFPRKSVSLLVIGGTLFYSTGCNHEKGPAYLNGYYHSGIYFGKNLPANYQHGIADGCTTSKGTYTKSHTLFNNNQNYHNGWFLGRNRCKHLLIVEDEKK